MILIWKCDFCSHTEEDSEKLEEHEKNCTFNPNNRSCYTCMNSYDTEVSIKCTKTLSTFFGLDGDCKGWKKDKNLHTDKRISVIEKIRQAFSDYRRAEGCSCCRDIEAHEEAEKRLGELLKPTLYEDGSGFNWWQYCSKNII